MMTRHQRGSMVWVDIESPTREELRSIIDEFSIDPEVEEEIISPTPYPLTLATPEYAYLILHFPVPDAERGARNQEVDIVVGKRFIITARYEVVRSLETLRKAFEAEELLGLPAHDPGPALLERILRHLYQAMGEEAEQVARRLEKIEQDIFSGKERQTVRTISEAGRVLLRFETVLARHGDPLDAFLAEVESSFFGKRFASFAARIKAERMHVAALVTSLRAVARELRTTNDSLLSSSQNEVMKIFTVMTVAFLPLTFIAGLFGMHSKHSPILGHPHDFALILIVMVVIELLLILFMRLKKWI